MSVSSITTFGSAAIASPPANESPATSMKPDDDTPAPVQIEPAAKPPGMGQFVDKSV
jgi:hypothetical protein